MTRYIKSFGNATLYRNDRTGIAWIIDPSTGVHLCHPNIYRTGSVKGMKEKGIWGKRDKTEKCGDYIFNISHMICTDKYDEIVANECMCKCCIERGGGLNVAY